MLVLTSVIVTVTPGSARPPASTMLPRSSPLTACADAHGAYTRSTRHAAKAVNQRFVIVSLPKPDSLYIQFAEVYMRRRHGVKGHLLPQPADPPYLPIPSRIPCNSAPAGIQEVVGRGSHAPPGNRPDSR